jgi:hypothetical protein
MLKNKKEQLAVVCAIFAAILIFVIGRFYWYQSEALDANQAGTATQGVDVDGGLDH